MAVSKVAYITSYYNGTARFYIMTKDGNNITTNLMSENPTTEHNGLEVTVRNVSIDKYKNAIDALLFFPNVYVDGISSIVNTTKIKKFKHFSFASTSVSNKILLGNVLYPLNSAILSGELMDFYRSIINSGIVFNFNIGELVVTPNRESIIYNSKTEALIISRIKDAYEEIKEIINNFIPSNYENPYKYFELYSDRIGFDFITNDIYYRYSSPRYVPTFEADTILNDKITLSGEKILNKNVLNWFHSVNPLLKAYVSSNKVYKEKYPWAVRSDMNSRDVKLLFVNPSLKLTTIIKAFLVDNYPNTPIITNPTFDSFKNEFFDCYHAYNSDKSDSITLKTLKICYDWYLKRGTFIDFDNHKPFLDYKEQIKKEAKENKTPVLKDVILYITPSTGYEVKKYFRTYPDAVKYIKTLSGGIVFRKLEDKDYGDFANRLKYINISANQKILSLLEKESFTAKVNVDTLFQNPTIVFYNTIKNSEFKKYFYTTLSPGFINTLSDDFIEITQKLKQIRLRNFEHFDNIIKSKNNTPIDNDLLIKLNQLAEYFDKYATLSTELDMPNIYDETVYDLMAYIIMKHKLYRVSNTCYNKIKSNKIILKLCKK